MTGSYKEHIESDIKEIRERHRINVSREMGQVLYSFVSYWKEHESEMIPAKFLNIIHGLEGYLTHRIMGGLVLEDTTRSGGEICKMLREKDMTKIAELEKYLNRLKARKPEEGIIQLSPEIPKTWLNRKYIANI
jgi:hypothetical protein